MNRRLGLSFGALAALAALCTVIALASTANAQVSGYSALEQSVVAQRLAERKLVLDPEPEGKIIEDVQIATMDVFDERDPVPDWVDVLHTTTRARVIRRELLFDEGTRYDARRVDETARNLRELIQLSIVLIVPARGSTADRVRVLVITKDVWSLRLNWLLQSQNAHINYLVLNPSEENLFGLHAIIGGLFVLDPARYSLGLTLGHRRLFGSHIQASAAASVIKNRETGAAEGSFGEFRYGEPLYSLDTEWSWGTSLLWQHDIARRFKGINVARYNAPATSLNDAIPVTYNRDRSYGGYQLVRSFGRRFKYDLSVGLEALRGEYSPRDLSAYDPRAAADFVRDQLPVSDQRISPFLQLHAHRTDYGSLIEVETLGLQENFRRGHDLVLRVYPASSKLGSSRDLIGSLATLSYTFPLADGLVRPLAGTIIEYAAHGKSDALFETRLHVVSPRFKLGRVVLDGQLSDRFRNYLNRKFLLGGDNRLRGYEPGAEQGASLLALNAELRTTSVDILSAQVGAAVFDDAGDAQDRVSDFRLKQSAGLGLRVLFPEFDRIVFRADWGFPLSPGYSTFPGAFFVSFAQAFSMPEVNAPNVLTETL